jgi:hypothetical protein
MIPALVAALATLQGYDGEGAASRLGFFALQVDEVPTGNWLSYGPAECDWRVTGEASALHVHVTGSTGYEHVEVSLWVTASGVRASAETGSCTHLWTGRHFAGVACLVTDGSVATLEFEIYDGLDGGARGRSLQGRVELGERGAQLARLVRAATRPDVLRTERLQLAGAHDRAPTLEVSGLVDALGRRQGPWTVRELDGGEVRVEMGWRDGIPDGLCCLNEDSATWLTVGAFERGFREGEEVSWRRGGTRQVVEYRHDRVQRTAQHAPDGTKNDERLEPRPFGDRAPEDYCDTFWEKVGRLHTRR